MEDLISVRIQRSAIKDVLSINNGGGAYTKSDQQLTIKTWDEGKITV